VLVAAAVCPHPPLLVPRIAAGAAPELDELRAACDAAVRTVLESTPDLLVVVGEAPSERSFPEGSWGTLAGYGVDIRVGAEHDGRQPSLPLSLTMGRWLLDRQPGKIPPQLFLGVRRDTDSRRCAHLGALLAEREARVGLVAMGDGSARRSLKGPGYLDPRAEPFDKQVVQALRDGKPDALLGLDSGLAATLLAGGRAAWQVIAGAAAGRRWSGHVGYAEAPYGVMYVVATWTPA
jgi:hypothetical protein